MTDATFLDIPTDHLSGPTSELDSPRDRRQPFTAFGPNWFAAVMGTGIVANAAATLPVHIPGLMALATGVWVLDLVVLALVLAATLAHWMHHPVIARSHLENPTMAPFYGAPAMALLTVGAGALLVGTPVLGSSAALACSAILWVSGTILGLVTAVLVPVRLFTTHRTEPDSAFGGWLMPIVPPMVSAATSTLLLPHLPAGQWQLTMLLAGYALFGLTLVSSLVVISLIWGRLAQHKVGAAAAVPTLWIVLGPIGQSITAAHNLGEGAGGVLEEPFAAGARVFGLLYGMPMWGFAMLWGSIALGLTVRTARRHLPFSLTWWSFTFPIGTVVTGTSGLAAVTQSDVLVAASMLLYLALVGAWVTVAVRTTRGIASGALLRPAGSVCMESPQRG